MAPLSFRQTLGQAPLTATTNDSALVIIDAQNEYAEGKLAVADVKSSRAAIGSLLSAYRAAGGRIVHVVHQVPAGAPVFTPDTPLASEFEELAIKSGAENEVLIQKNFPGSFTKTNLDETLKGWGVNKVVLAGYMAHVCVSTTAREAYQAGYEVVLARDAIGDRDIPGVGGAELTKTVLLELDDCFGTVVGSKDIK
ncbi:isochorismatase hydrolase [Pseudovirgaria hyperparasitica]|uniref:Isochorismatase hydrolase n=1 Tax=Pseudovirgaria hyperparasitica TaxID=470096 RepID=A0A6A6WCB7_9PEZI|nr:isochorismatase hydrolase [Pseudovirgaria hyperparasitica]KAF2759207.1 isochorismatase hydrolase [Pseudovirgaria hyperparasitica]